jgi:hypothetical protein
MRGLVAVSMLLAVSTPCLAKTVLKSEPYFLAPFSVVYVDNGVCGVGKVLKVKGALGAMRRQKICVPMGLEQASLTSPGSDQAPLVVAIP